jgi:hypothetical protein
MTEMNGERRGFEGFNSVTIGEYLAAGVRSAKVVYGPLFPIARDPRIKPELSCILS